MVLFEYNCKNHGSFEMMRPMGLRKHPAPCPDCGKLAPRAYSAPVVDHMDPTKKKAIERNIKSQYEPQICETGCCSDLHLPPSHRQKPRQESYNGPRSWVIEHAV